MNDSLGNSGNITPILLLSHLLEAFSDFMSAKRVDAARIMEYGEMVFLFLAINDAVMIMTDNFNFMKELEWIIELIIEWGIHQTEGIDYCSGE